MAALDSPVKRYQEHVGDAIGLAANPSTQHWPFELARAQVYATLAVAAQLEIANAIAREKP